MIQNSAYDTNPPLEAVIFDLDDTLITWEHKELGWQEYYQPFLLNLITYLEDQGYEGVTSEALFPTYIDILRTSWADAQEKEEYAVTMAHVFDQAFTRLGLDNVHIPSALKSLDWKPMPGVQLYPDTLSVLAELRQRGLKIGLITNAYQPMWMRDVELEAYDLIDKFDARITSGDTGFLKPHPAIFWRMLGLLDTLPERAIYVGDNPTADVHGANKVGITSIFIDPPHLNKPITHSPPDHTITSLTDLLPIITNRLKN